MARRVLNGVFAVTRELSFGDSGSGRDCLLGDILVYDADLTPAEVLDAEGFLRAKYNL